MTKKIPPAPTVEESRAHFEKYLISLPPELRQDYERFNQKMIVNTLRGKTQYPSLAEIQNHIKDVSWYWDYRITNGKMTVLAGEGGAGKSMLALKICQIQIHDKTFPDGSPVHRAGAPVLYIDCEGFASGIKQRANAWQMNLKKFFLWSVDLEKDGFINFANPAFRDELVKRIESISPKPALIVIDSLGNASAGGQDKVENVRDLLNFFNQIAYEFDLALILVAHTRKMPALMVGEKQGVTQDDVRGSGHLINMARSVLGVWQVQTSSEQDPNAPRMMAVIKSNYGKKPKPIGYEVLSDANDNPKIFFGDAPTPYKEPSKMDLCAELILEALKEKGKPMPPRELETLAREEGYKRDTFYAAHRLLEKKKLITDTLENKNPKNAWQLVKKLR